MMTAHEQADMRASAVVKLLPMSAIGKVSPAYVLATYGPLVMAGHALPAPKA